MTSSTEGFRVLSGWKKNRPALYAEVERADGSLEGPWEARIERLVGERLTISDPGRGLLRDFDIEESIVSVLTSEKVPQRLRNKFSAIVDVYSLTDGSRLRLAEYPTGGLAQRVAF